MFPLRFLQTAGGRPSAFYRPGRTHCNFSISGGPGRGTGRVGRVPVPAAYGRRGRPAARIVSSIVARTEGGSSARRLANFATSKGCLSEAAKSAPLSAPPSEGRFCKSLSVQDLRRSVRVLIGLNGPPSLHPGVRVRGLHRGRCRRLPPSLHLANRHSSARGGFWAGRAARSISRTPPRFTRQGGRAAGPPAFPGDPIAPHRAGRSTEVEGLLDITKFQVPGSH